MEKIVTNELTKVVIMTALGVAGLSAILVKLIAKVRGSINTYKKDTIVYLLVSSILSGAVGCLGYWSPLTDQLTFYIVFQFCFLLLGVAHVNLMPKCVKWSSDHTTLWLEMGFTISIALAGSIALLIVYSFFNSNGLQYDMLTCVGFFIVPWFIDQTFKTSIKIPRRVFKLWYPVEKEIEALDFRDHKLIGFEFQKNSNTQYCTNFRAKAPSHMEMGTLFYCFINDYNDRYLHDRIEFINETGEPQGWLFYKKRKWYSIITRYIDAEKTIFNNRIKENDVIICNRVCN